MIAKTRSACGLVLALVFASAPAFAAEEKTAQLVVTTISGERFIGTAGADEPGYVRLFSETLGEIRISRAAIKTMTTGPKDEVAVAPPAAPVAAAVPAPPPLAAVPPTAPAKMGLIQSVLHLPGKFNASVGFGLASQTGLFDQRTLSTSANVQWDLASYVYQSTYTTSRQTTQGHVLADSVLWDNRLQRNLNPKYFLFADAQYRSDSIMALKQQEVIFAGPGINFVKTPTIEVVTVVGPSYIWQRYDPVAPALTAAAPLKTAAAVIFQSLSYTHKSRLRFSATGLLAQSVETGGKQLAQAIVSMDLALTEYLSLSNSYTWYRDSLRRVGTDKSQSMFTSQLRIQL